jgi:putative peptide modification system cyclase
VDEPVSDVREHPPARVARAPSAAHGPRVRTLLICDIVDSTALVERMGDAPAAELLRRHDRIARDLMHAGGGREIDKTDGFLTLFERPIEAVAFAMAYHRALRTLGDDVKQTLRARVGIHVGEVVLWENAPADIADGAKPIDVEGLAKPVAARLMSLALPGQTLLSGVAFSLAQRAESELQAAASMRWLTHGRYRFKGVPAPMLVHEVGETGFSPLQAPPSTSKAQRDVPLWRKPGIVALEVIAISVIIGVGFALSLRTPPAIAFGERDWIVIGELRNLTGETLLDESLDTAFRISLEQSRYVNVLPNMKLRDALQRMQRAPDTPVDRGVASEIALRDGARAVVLATVAEIGGRVRVSAEVVDPNTQTTVYAESADGIGVESTLESIDLVTHKLREKLGEAIAAIEQSSEPLPKVTSASLDALRAYALADRAVIEGRLEEAEQLFEQALQHDPEFALALTGLARVRYRNDDRAGAVRYVQRAVALKGRLTPRDALYVDAWAASFEAPARAIEKWKLLSSLYPDFHVAQFNLAMYSWGLVSDAESCVRIASGIDVPQNPSRSDVVYMKAACLLGTGRIDESLTEFERAESLGLAGQGIYHARALAAKKDFAAAAVRLEKVGASPNAVASDDQTNATATIQVDRGDLSAALETLRTPEVSAASIESSAQRSLRVQYALTASVDGATAEELAELEHLLDARIAELDSDPPEEWRPVAFDVAALGLCAARAGALAAGWRAHRALDGDDWISQYPVHAALRQALQAELLSAEGKHAEAIATLQRFADSTMLLQQQATLLRILQAAGEHARAATVAQDLMRSRGHAYWEWGGRGVLSQLNLAEVNLAALRAAEANLALGESEAAQRDLGVFAEAWPPDRWPEAIKQRVLAISEHAVSGK